jgi:hypothetical protein
LELLMHGHADPHDNHFTHENEFGDEVDEHGEHKRCTGLQLTGISSTRQLLS